MESFLPPEIWALIFSHLSKRRLASIRLVCKTFRDLGTRYLFPRIVLSNRLDSLLQLLDVLEHPDLCRHITELVYDTSNYCELTAKNITRHDHIYFRSPSIVHTFQKPELPSSNLKRLRLRITQLRSRENPGNDVTSLWRLPDIFNCFIKYCERWSEQVIIRGEDLQLEMLRHALRQLPSLSKITYSDFRYLAMPGEPYLNLCQRMFAGIIAPDSLGAGSGSRESMDDFRSFLKVVTAIPEAKIQSFCIGDHPYEFSPSDPYEFSPLDSFDSLTRETVHMPQHRFGLRLVSPDSGHIKHHLRAEHAAQLRPFFAFGGLTHLRLPFEIPEFIERGISDREFNDLNLQLRPFLRCNASTLVHLTLSVVESEHYLLYIPRGETFVRVRHDFLPALVDGLIFTSLRCLELHWWKFQEADYLKDFISRHSSTLRKIRLLRCTLDYPNDLKTWIQENTPLINGEINVEQGVFVF